MVVHLRLLRYRQTTQLHAILPYITINGADDQPESITSRSRIKFVFSVRFRGFEYCYASAAIFFVGSRPTVIITEFPNTRTFRIRAIFTGVVDILPHELIHRRKRDPSAEGRWTFSLASRCVRGKRLDHGETTDDDEFDMSAIPPVQLGLPGCGDDILAPAPLGTFNIGYTPGPYDPMVIETPTNACWASTGFFLDTFAHILDSIYSV
ncbi:hypothetical protein L210DRAFT_3654126 [Boletus edulis BED1]|uniref:Uncharacterized protein n=1 Tax=Boletus edulis BED1 TaxID=1328754 RepID=A0AAD4G6U4_BOLED|nr:hypothetical protein L210DRAFT_3654126 [Boletus edulis BED1]